MNVSDKLIQHYRSLKREAEGLVLLMQVGAFMQVMDADARTLSALTGLKLQMAGAVDDPVVVGGFPKSGLDQTIGKLVRAGHSVAIAWQDEDKVRAIGERILVRGAPLDAST
jgi:DNA mismatch repair ATPase MutS